MARRELNKLSPRRVETVTEPGRHSDGGGLYLFVEKSGAKRWVFLFRWRTPGAKGTGKLREMGLGSLLNVSLAQARRKAERARSQLGDGIDPIEAAKAEREIPTFGDFADKVVDRLADGWRNEKHAAQWKTTFSRYAADLRDKPVDAISTDDVLGVLTPLWEKTPETASRVRGRIERILSAAKARGYRSGENPAAWRGHLDHLLPKRQKLSRGHHPAMPYGDVGAFLARLREREAMAARALEFTILTAARSGETFGAVWSEIDLEGAIWTRPPNRMKGAVEHRVPLSEAALKVLRPLYEARTGKYVFPTARKDKPLSNMAMTAQLRRMGLGHFTVHGFRSTFRDWAAERTNYPNHVVEMALAHPIGDKVEAAYRRGDLFDKRRPLMTDWARFCGRHKGDNVTQLPRRA